jgi:hypothetical protein
MMSFLEYLFENWGQTVMIRVSDDISQKVSHIHKYPEHYPITIKSKNVRRCVAAPQTSVYYKIFSDRIEIQSIFDNRQDPKKLRNLK